jgi:hypothetical protein
VFEGGFRNLVRQDRVLDCENGGSWDSEKDFVFFYVMKGNLESLADVLQVCEEGKVGSSAPEERY